MQYTTNYNYSLPESDDVLETASRVGYNNNFSDIDTQIKDANDDIDSIGEEVDTISTQIGAIDTQIGELDTRIDTIEAQDYIVEQNVSDGILYKKWNSGYAEIDGTKSVTTADSSSTGNGYHSEGVYIDLPITLTACYNLLMTSGDADLFASRYGSLGSITNRFGFRICSYKPISAGSHTTSFRVTGRWK